MAIRSFGSVFSMELPADSPAHQLAAELSAQIETALTVLGMELDTRYHIPRSEQLALADQTAANAISDQAVGEVARLVDREKSSIVSGSPEEAAAEVQEIFENLAERERNSDIL